MRWIAEIILDPINRVIMFNAVWQVRRRNLPSQACTARGDRGVAVFGTFRGDHQRDATRRTIVDTDARDAIVAIKPTVGVAQNMPSSWPRLVRC